MKQLPLFDEREAFRRWSEYTVRCDYDGITWAEWKEAYSQGIIR